MKKKYFYLILLLLILLSIFLLNNLLSITDRTDSEDLTIVTTFTILEDFTNQIVGENNVRVICPVGAEIHEWELLPENFIDLEEANIVFYNGLNVEQWMDQVKETVKSDVPVVAVGEKSNYPRLPIIIGDYAGDPDPHIWMDPLGAISYVEVIRDVLMEINPEKADQYKNNADQYIEKLYQLHDDIEKKLSAIPENNRILITTEAAFIYFTDAYNFKHNGVWGTNTEEEGTPQQMKKIYELVKQENPSGLFWESTGSDRYMNSISQDTGIPVYGPLYVDSVDKSGSGVESYIKMMKANARLLVNVMGDE